MPKVVVAFVRLKDSHGRYWWVDLLGPVPVLSNDADLCLDGKESAIQKQAGSGQLMENEDERFRLS
jgi:hypothetical protein